LAKSNYAAPPQLVDAVPYRDLGEMGEFARRWPGARRHLAGRFPAVLAHLLSLI
jgi:hypothetical protein